MKLLDRFLGDLRRLRSAATLEYFRRPVQQGELQLVDHRRMHAEPARQFGDRLLVLQRLVGDAGFEMRLVLLALQYL